MDDERYDIVYQLMDSEDEGWIAEMIIVNYKGLKNVQVRLLFKNYNYRLNTS